MTKRQFLDTLRSQLQGELNDAQIDGHIHYYDEYIKEEMAAGKTEAEVMEELGSPVFIAKTLLSTPEAAARQKGETYQEETGESDGAGDFFNRRIHTWNINPFVAKWVIPILLVLILILVLSLLGTAVVLVARFFIPILLVVLVIAIFKSHGGE